MTAKWQAFLVFILSSLRAHCQGWLQSLMAVTSFVYYMADSILSPLLLFLLLASLLVNEFILL